ncbi:MAG: hypothetical protein OEZ48_05695 [Candidatus Bathyarchaeota archaeon]|nr:hypothetical protein [Candidatus Bathyarchaeota archaeon]
MVEKSLGKRYIEPKLIREFRERFYGQIHDLKSLELINGIYLFQMFSGRSYVTRDTLYERLEIEPSRIRAYDSRLKTLLETGWFELDNGIKGRYRLTPLGRLQVAERADRIDRTLAAVTYEETLQYAMKAKVNPPELMSMPNVRNNCILRLTKKGYEAIKTDGERVIMIYQILQDHALVEVVLEANEIEIRTTSNYVHTFKRPVGVSSFFDIEGIKALDIDEEKFVLALTVMVLYQVLQTIIEVSMIEGGGWKFLKSFDFIVLRAERETQPKYYILNQ